ncbi:MAG: ABC transporter substrate-binding protein [Thaumarchaeota archaeon]|nr:ABC transporter substrate-binding protein [Nitrososphaerota archaeon]
MTYDRTRALIDGTVKPEGVELNYLAIENPSDIFVRMLKHHEFQASELSLSSYYTAAAQNPPFIAIPVFPSRLFRQSYIFVNADSNIKEPRDLIGKKVGTPRYHMTAPIWIRGILQHEYDIPLEKIRWFTERPEKITSQRMNVKLEMIPESTTLDQLLESGELDAITEAHLLPSYLRGSTKVKRLFPDYKTVEIEYYRKTRIFPIMHTVVIRRDVYDANPWVAVSLHKAFTEAKKACYTARLDPVQGKESYPWALAALEEEKRLMGDDPYPYSIEENRHVLKALLQYMFEQGLVDKEVPLESMFAPNTLSIKG